MDTWGSQLLTADEIAQLSVDIADGKATLKDIEAEIDTMRANLAAAEIRRDELRRSILVKESMRAPINRLPTEVLSVIFEFCLEPMTSTFAEKNTRSMIALDNIPLLLTKICLRWRSVALVTPLIWSVIEIRDPTLLTPDLYNTFSLWTTHSHIPLDVFLCKSFAGSIELMRTSMPEGQLVKLLKKLQTVIPRARILIFEQIDVGRWSAFKHIVLPRQELPLLEELRIGQSSQPWGVTVLAPKLHTLDVKCALQYDHVLRMFPLSLESIRTLKIYLHTLSGVDFCTFLSRLPNLQHLRCEFSQLRLPLALDPAKKITLAHLETLTIKWNETLGTAPAFFNPINFPSLRELAFKTDSVSMFHTLAIMTNTSFSATLTSLNLEWFDLGATVTLWRSLVVLQKLQLRSCFNGEFLMTLLSRPNPADGKWPCPKLETITLFRWGPSTMWESLLELARLRGFKKDAGENPVAGRAPLERIDAWVLGDVKDHPFLPKLSAVGISLHKSTTIYN